MRALVVAAVCLLGGCDIVLGLKEHHDGGSHDPLVDAPRPDGEPTNCPITYDKILQTTASRYRLVGSGQSWSAARAACAADMPGVTHLLVLSNEEEWRAIIAQPQLFLPVNTWVGFSDLKTEGQFQWVTDEPTTYASTGRVLPWDFDQPEAPGTTSARDNDCVAMRVSSGVLHDDDCSGTANFICECDARADDPAR
jgi:hypothetical protein